MSSNSNEEIVYVTPKMADLSPEYAEIMVLGKVLQMSGYFKDVRDQAQAVTKILCGRELGFSPIVSMQGIHIIEGKPALSSNLMATLIKRSGKYDYRVKVWSNTECVLMFRENVGGKWEEVGESSFNMDDAKMAGVLRAGGSWSKYPKAMLFARALSQGLRTYCPDVSASPIYNPEEMGAEVNGDGEVTELPKSARPVAVTTEPISVAPPKKAAAVPAATNINGAVEPQKAADRDGGQIAGREAQVASREAGNNQDDKSRSPAPTEAMADALMRKLADKTPHPVQDSTAGDDTSFDPDACIDLPEQRAIHRQAREATTISAKDADVYFREYLKKHGYVDDEGKGSTKRIPRALFAEVKADVIAYMGSLK